MKGWKTLNVKDIVDRFALLASLSEEAASNFTYICSDAKDEINSKLLPDVDLTLHSERLVAAAGALSLYKYMQLKALGDSVESFSAGDITVKKSMDKALGVAYEIWQNEKAKISDLLKDEDFVFWRVN